MTLSTGMSDGFFGKVLLIDLWRGVTEEQSLPPATYQEYLSGHGLGVRLLYER
ncbi:MAG: hypothetical protein GTO41_11190, partial [Burkholderiales bacterium]|nr:hypothetical protein [Burkholderiales bacterium]